MIKTLIDILPGIEVEIELAADISEVAGKIGEGNGHSDHDMDVTFVKFEEAAESLHASSLLVQLYADRLVIGHLGEGSQHTEHQLLVGGK